MLTKKYDKPSKLIIPPTINRHIESSAEFQIAKAERHFYNCDFTNCLKQTSRFGFTVLGLSKI